MFRALITFVAAAGLVSAQGSSASLDDAASAVQSGRFDVAVTALTAFLKDHPRDVQALMLMGIALDSQQRYQDAGPYYERALKLAPDAAPVLNNAANHWLASGDSARARRLFLRVLAVDPGHVNALVQLAQMSVAAKHGAEALDYLKRLPASAENDATLLLRAQALAEAGRCADMQSALERLGPDAAKDTRTQFSAGIALAKCGQYAEAERSFGQALEGEPTDFDILYNLGVAALRAGDAARAVDVLTRAAAVRGDADTLFALAQALAARQQLIEAASVLTRARGAAPQRADIIRLLAQVSARLEFYQDAAAAWDEYLKLKPDDDEARRERGFAYARAAQTPQALADLSWYVARHPRDARGWYELATAQALGHEAEALRSLDRALGLDPALVDAHFARAVLNLKNEHPDRSVADLKMVLEREPRNQYALTRLGQAYLALGHAPQAVPVLKEAVAAAPDDAAALLQYYRALVKTGQTQEAAAIRARLSQAADRGPRPDEGLVQYLGMSPAEQRERYLENLRRIVAGNPRNADARIRLADQLLAQGDSNEGIDLLRQACAGSGDDALSVRCGTTLLNHEQYQAALPFLTQAATKLASARLDLAIALFHTKSAEAAIAELDRTPAAERQGDFYLLRAELLDAMGKVAEAADALNRGIRAAPARPSLYLEATGFLLKRGLYRQALEFVEAATRLLPDERELALAQAITLELLNRRDDASRLLDRMQERWPEWDRPWLLRGMLLESQYQSAEARQALETAIALGAGTPEAYYYLALAITHAAPDDTAAAQKAIEEAMKRTSSDPYVYLLAGKIALARNDYPTALQRLQEALRLSPQLVAAHDAMRRTYHAMGDDAKAEAEATAMKEITENRKAPDEAPAALGNLLFSVHPAQ
ncbi:MAG TPA: tetratricopeptide repeat protein [Bryobacteraceae bacterium]|nr:tetratricopeptide repeat protein [Bryobacteraceae bacterium]